MPSLKGLVGIPFLDEGRNPSEGLDCWGLMVVAQERYGHRVPDFQIPCKATEEIGGVVASELGRWQKVTVPEPGDVVMMALNPLHPDTIQHFGTFVGDGRFLHTLEKSGSILSSIHHDYWSRKIRGYVRWAG